MWLSKFLRCQSVRRVCGHVVGVSNVGRRSGVSHGIRPLATGRMKVARRNTWPSSGYPPIPSRSAAPWRNGPLALISTAGRARDRLPNTRDQTPATNQKSLESDCICNCNCTTTAPFCTHGREQLADPLDSIVPWHTAEEKSQRQKHTRRPNHWPKDRLWQSIALMIYGAKMHNILELKT